MRRIAAALTALLVALPLAAVAQDATVAVTVNGSPVSFDQPPVERVGRVYVPLRGVFEQLGASVVYDGGRIDATRGTTTISLQIGSNTAIVNGAQTALDAPPFLIGARTLVPLRFVAQALGASVNYDGNTRTVAILQATPAPAVVLTPAPRPPARLIRIEPAPGTTVSGVRPQISGTFPIPVNPNAVRVRLDGRDITPAAYVSTRAFSYDPQYDLPYGTHQVAVRASGVAQEWEFTNAPVPSPNFLSDVSPPNGAVVAPTFTIRGTTQPESHVHIVAATNLQVGFGEVNANTVTADVVADPNGRFGRTIVIVDISSGVIDVRITSTAPDGAVAVRTLRLRPAPR
jgi:hypothetical protein